MTVTVTRKHSVMQSQNREEFFRRLDRTLARRYIHQYILGREERRRVTSNENGLPPTIPEFWQPRYVVSVIIKLLLLTLMF